MKIKNKEVRLLRDNGTEFDLMQDYYNYLEGNLSIITPDMLNNITATRRTAWYYDSAIQAVEFPSNITKVRTFGLYGCTRLVEVKFSDQFPYDGFTNESNIMTGSNSLTVVYFPMDGVYTWVTNLLPTLAQVYDLHLLVNENQLSTYKSTTTWSNYKSRTFAIPTHTQDLANEQWTQGLYDTTTGVFTSNVNHMCTNKFNIYDLDISYNSLSLFYGTGNITAAARPSAISVHFWDEGNNYLGYQYSTAATGRTGLEFIAPLGTYYIAFEMYYSGITLNNPTASVAKVINLLPWKNGSVSLDSFLPITRLQEIRETDSIWFTPFLSEVSSIGEKELFTIGLDNNTNITVSTHLDGSTYVLQISGAASLYIDINSGTETEIKIDNKTLPEWMLSQGWGTINTIQSITPEGLKFLGLERN